MVRKKLKLKVDTIGYMPAKDRIFQEDIHNERFS